VNQRLFAVGRVLAPWGIRGDVVIAVLSDNPDRFRTGAGVLLAGRPCTVQRHRVVAGKTVVKLSGVADRNQAEALRGSLLEVAETDLMSLPPDTYFHHQIIGLEAVTTDGRGLGPVSEVLKTGANDVYVIHGDREYLIPAIGDAVKQVDLEGGRIVIEALPGLLE